MLILHTADWQIGAQFGQFDPAEAAYLADARLETVRTIASLATQRCVDAVVVAGDVFDQQTVGDIVIRRLFAALDGFAGPWYLLPGNHDAALLESVWTRAARLGCIPENAHPLLAPGVTLQDNIKLAVLAAPLTQRNTFDDTTQFFDSLETPEGYVRLGLAHGSVTGLLQEGIDATNPISADRASTARLDYLALGDWHGTVEVNPRTWYAGTHEQDRFRGNDPGNVLEVQIGLPGQEPAVTVHRVSRYRWHRWESTVSLPTDIESLRARLATLGATDILRLIVEGVVSLGDAESLRTLIDETQARIRALRSDTTNVRVMPTEDEVALLASKGGYLSRVVERLRDAQKDPLQAATATDALLLLAQYNRESGAQT